ncbi:glycosyltransferase [Rubritalea sp.]|uniref:glycosyltransferase n=1 Tax=Rubritalea sp. TaxID=2109375 RepID=UPI003EF0BAE9
MIKAHKQRLRVDGKFFQLDGRRHFLKAVTYGPFPEPQLNNAEEFQKMKALGINAIRVYTSPNLELLDAASEAGLLVFVGFDWQWSRVFLEGADQVVFEQAKQDLKKELAQWGQHPAVAACFVANEIRPDIANWSNPVSVREALEELIEIVKMETPHLLAAYANYPSSEYLEPSNADFTAVNVYLENAENFQSYLRRLHHLAGDRPVLISEFGADSESLELERQAELLRWALHSSQSEGMAGWTCFSWSDKWLIAGEADTQWGFGLSDRSGELKPAASVLSEHWVPAFPMPMISVIICVYNGADRIGEAVASLEALNYPNYEVIVVDDGSSDATRDVVRSYSYARLVEARHGGLSAARNLGASMARGEILSYTDDDCVVDQDYLFWLAKSYAENGWDACGGPNIPPKAIIEDEAVVASAPGAPSHVMLSDSEAEHIPGCHLSVTKKAFDAIGGFRAQYRVAGDDVDFCWRLRNGGFVIGFHGASFVWHRRRTRLKNYFRQQRGYGKAEALLMKDHPEKFRRGSGARWEGCVYTGAAASASDGSVIYHGPAGLAGYQLFWNPVMPMRLLDRDFRYPLVQLKLLLACRLQPIVRKWSRRHYGREEIAKLKVEECEAAATVVQAGECREILLPILQSEYRGEVLQHLLNSGWRHAGDYEAWDLSRGEMKAVLVSELLGRNAWRVRVRFLAPITDLQRLERELIEVVAC